MEAILESLRSKGLAFRPILPGEQELFKPLPPEKPAAPSPDSPALAFPIPEDVMIEPLPPSPDRLEEYLKPPPPAGGKEPRT